MTRPSSERDGSCICDYNPSTTDGPDEACPFHGRPYNYWVRAAEEAEARVARVEALCTRWDALTKGESATTREIRAEIRGDAFGPVPAASTHNDRL